MASSAEPAYLKIKNDLLQRIREGELRPGDKIDHEEDIARQYGCARATANRAIKELAEEGIVQRKRRAGTRVAAAGMRATRVTIPLVRQEIESHGASYRFSMLEQKLEIPNGAVAAALKLEPNTQALYLKSVHFADDRPYQLEERWINLLMAPEAAKAEFEAMNPNEWLVENLPYAEAAHYFSAQNADAVQAKILDIAPHDAIFMIERQTQLGGQMITYARLLHPGALYRMTAQNFSFSTKN